jgi:hypothetical protein
VKNGAGLEADIEADMFREEDWMGWSFVFALTGFTMRSNGTGGHSASMAEYFDT